MTYNVFSVTLNPIQSINPVWQRLAKQTKCLALHGFAVIST